MSAQEGLVEFLEAVSRSFNIRAAAANEDINYQSHTANARTCLKVRDALVAKDDRITSLESELAEARQKNIDWARGNLQQERRAQRAEVEAAQVRNHNANLREALDNSQSLLVATLHEKRPIPEIKDQIVDNRAALAGHEQPAPTMTAEQMREAAAMECERQRPGFCGDDRDVIRHDTLTDVAERIRALPASPGKGGGAWR